MSVEIINGSRTSFGPRDSEVKLPTAVHNAGVKKQVVIPVKYDDLPSHTEDDVTGAALPANSVVTGIYASPANTDFAGGTSYDINLVEDDGTSISTIGTAALADLNSGAEVTVDTAAVGADTAYIELGENGTFTAGEGAIVVEYIEQIDVF